MENKAPRYINTNEIIYIYNRWIEQLQSPEDAGALEGVQSCLDVLLEQPIVDAVPVVHGRWIKYITCYRCSECGHQVTSADNFCPNCGAKMDLEE